MGFDVILDLEKRNKVQGSMFVVIVIFIKVFNQIVLVKVLVYIFGDIYSNSIIFWKIYELYILKSIL